MAGTNWGGGLARGGLEMREASRFHTSAESSCASTSGLERVLVVIMSSRQGIMRDFA